MEVMILVLKECNAQAAWPQTVSSETWLGMVSINTTKMVLQSISIS
jgi:hypothetical protein